MFNDYRYIALIKIITILYIRLSITHPLPNDLDDGGHDGDGKHGHGHGRYGNGGHGHGGLTPFPTTQMIVAMMEMAVAVRAGGAKLVMYCIIETCDQGNHIKMH